MTAKRAGAVDAAARSRARRRALQAVYAWEMSGQDMGRIAAQFRAEQDMKVVDGAFFDDLLAGVAAHRDELDQGLAPYLDRAIEDVDPVERAALRLGAYELKYRPDVPYRVVLNEAVEVTKRFGAEHGHTYVNGVLDKLATAWRVVEKGQ